MPRPPPFPRTDITRPPDKVAMTAAALGISPAELEAAGREDAAGALEQIMRKTAAEPDVAAVLGTTDGSDGDAGMAALMSQVLQGLRHIDAEFRHTPKVRQQIRREFLAILTQDAASVQRQIAVLHRAADM